MHWSSKLPTIAVLLALGASRAAAQEHGRVALDLGYPPAFAVLWRVSDAIAVRPDFTFSYNGGGQGATGWSLVPGVSSLASIHPSGSLTPYAGARLAGFWIKGGTGPEQWLAGPVVGARYAIERHFGVSAETGIGYTRLRFAFGGSGAIIPIDRWSLTPTGRVSALLYF